MSAKERLDGALFARGLAQSREQAKKLVMAGTVYVNGQKASKASQMVLPDDALEVRGHALPYVSRGGLKLEKALRVFPIDVNGLVCADVGASTGGFTDCLLQNGARKVYSLDVGYGQLDWKLRNDERVVVMERTNARSMEPAWFDETPQFGCMDVSFISIRLILPALLTVLAPGSNVVALIKPQFEAGRENVGKKGVVRDSAVHAQVIEDMLAFVRETEFGVRGLDFSPITGPEGNIEFLLWLQKGGEHAWDSSEDGLRAKETALLAKAFHQKEKESKEKGQKESADAAQ